MNFIKDIGINLQMGGFILTGREKPIVVLRSGVELFPDEYDSDLGYLMFYNHNDSEFSGLVQLEHPTADEFKAIIRQVDLKEVELTDEWESKVIVRKTQRSADTKVTWEVFRRDGYRCRYCGVAGGEDGATLSYDHVKLWEDGGEWSRHNGITACRKCNHQRGNTDYEEWINGPIYNRKKEGLSDEVIWANEQLVDLYKNFPTRVSTRRR